MNESTVVSWKDFSEAQSIICQACITKITAKEKCDCSKCPVHKTSATYYKEIDADMIRRGLQQRILFYRIESKKAWLLFGFQYIEAPLTPLNLPDITEEDKINHVVCSVMPVIREMYNNHNEHPVYLSLLRYLLSTLQ